MPENRQPGKLAVILHADIAGSTTLVQQDEHLAHERIQDTFRRFSNFIAQYQGQVRELRGDALLAEFDRASDAVSVALAFQESQAEYISQLNDNILPRVRVGIAMGEVVIADNTVTGEGVVLAQRIEQLAEPGGLCITGAINEALPTRLPFDQKNLGERQVKGFDQPVRVYRVTLKIGEVVPPPEKTQKRKTSNVLGISAAVATTVLIIAGAIAFWFQPWQPEEDPASIERMTFPLPDKPSVAVLPFDNLSGDADDDTLVDGFTETIIGTLARVPNLFVIARNSTFTYKGKPVKIQQVAEDLGVQYVLEGSIQRSGDQIRITAQLIDALSGRHIWADRYDREITDIFTLQDEITLSILRELQIVLTENRETAIRVDSETSNLEAYISFWKATSLYRNFNRNDNIRARELLEEVLTLDPAFVRAVALAGWTHQMDARFSWSQSSEESYQLAASTAQKAFDLDPEHPSVHALLSGVYLSQRDFDKAIEAGQKSIDLAPSSSLFYANTAIATYYAGDFEKTVALTKEAMRLSPFYPAWYLYRIGVAYRMLGRYEEALEALKSFYGRLPKPNLAVLTALAATYSEMGNLDEARAVIKETMDLYPNASLEQAEKMHYFKNPDHIKQILDALSRAGLPEHPPLELPDKPSIAILPFTNMSDDPRQEYFVDGMTEDLITDLSKLSGLFVIARNSSFTYKGKTADVKNVARDLGVRYVMEGSVRRVENQVRINAQLIDATTGEHIWAERYDGTLENIFSLQDHVTEQIVSALAINLTDVEQANEKTVETNKPKAYDAFLQGWDHYRQGTPDGLKKSIAYLEQATKLDPYYSRAYAALAAVYWRIYSNRWYEQVLGVGYSFPAMEKAREYLKEAKKSPTPLAHQVAAEISAHLDEGSERVIAPNEAKHAIALDPNDPVSHLAMAMALLKWGKAAEAEQRVRQAMRLDPLYPTSYLVLLAWTQFAMGEYVDAVATLERVVDLDAANHRTYIYLAATYGHLGRQVDANMALDKANELRAKAGWGPYTLASVDELEWIGDSTLFKEGLRKAGVASGSDDWSRLVKTVLIEETGASRIEVEGATTIDVEKAKTLHDQNVPFIDVSKPWYQEHIPGSHFLMIWFTGRDTEFNEVRLARIAERSQPLVIYSSGLERRAANACAMAVTWGFQHVYYFENGLQKWKAAGYTVARGN